MRLCTLVFSSVLGGTGGLISQAYAVSEGGAQTQASPFFTDAVIQAHTFYVYRDRQRYDLERGEYRTNLLHSTGQTSVDFESGLIARTFGIDFGVFGATDFENKGSPDHESSFFPWDHPWAADWSKKETRSGVSVYKAALRFKSEQLWAKTGYFQPSGPGVLGVNWNFVPGVYRGLEIGTSSGPLMIAGAYVNAYKAPWFLEPYGFRKNDTVSRVSYLRSMGVRYQVIDPLSVELAYGDGQDYLKNAHLKLKYQAPQSDALYMTYQLYAMDDSEGGASVNNNFSRLATQHYVSARYGVDSWIIQTDFMYTQAPQSRPENRGYFAYRLTSANGGANGAYEPWWDLRSDWNHDQEKAAFFKITRMLNDFGWKGWSVAAYGAVGWGGRAYGVSERLGESAYAVDLTYTVPEGRWKKTSMKLHYARYDNHTNLPSWTGFNNAFQDEHDIRFTLVIPWQM